jgi:hypothetical protein
MSVNKWLQHSPFEKGAGGLSLKTLLINLPTLLASLIHKWILQEGIKIAISVV